MEKQYQDAAFRRFVVVLVISFIGLAFVAIGCDAEVPQSPIPTPVGAQSKPTKDPCVAELEKTNAALEEIRERLNLLAATDAAERASDRVYYPKFEISTVEIVYIPDCVVDEEPTADHPIIFICAYESDFLGKLVELTLEELKQVEYELQEGGVAAWIYFPQ